jgi:acetyl esterase/lipase
MTGPEVPRVERVVYELPGMDQVVVRRDIPYAPGTGEDDLLLDLYLPADVAPGARRPAVLFVHGGWARTRPIRAKEHGVFRCWGRLAAVVGLAGVAFNHRRPGQDLGALDEAAGDVDRLVEYVRAHAAELRIDGDRLALFAFSSAPPEGLRTALRDRPPYVRCLVIYNGIMDLRPYREEVARTASDARLDAYSPAALVAAGAPDRPTLPPMFLARAGRDDVPRLNETIDRFVAAALAVNAPLTVVNHPTGRHAFGTLDPGPRSREIIRDTLTFLTTHLRELASPKAVDRSSVT